MELIKPSPGSHYRGQKYGRCLHDKTNLDECFDRYRPGRDSRFDNNPGPCAAGRLLPRNLSRCANVRRLCIRHLPAYGWLLGTNPCERLPRPYREHEWAPDLWWRRVWVFLRPRFDRDRYDRDYRGGYDRGPYSYGR